MENNTNEHVHRAGFVNIIGKPNVGKSTLLNALVGEQMAVTNPKAQTTRHRIIGIVNGDNYQIVYSDTPGVIEEPAYRMQEAMMGFVKTAFDDADVLLVLLDVKDTIEDVPALNALMHKIKSPYVVLLNKIDLSDQEAVQQKVDYWTKQWNANAVIPISALHKANLNYVQDVVGSLLPENPPFYDKDALTDKPERFFVEEIIREKILSNYRQEIPYSVEIVVQSFKDLPDIVRINAIVYANRQSQKHILIGKGGKAITRVGTEARKELEKRYQKKVFLELYVKVKEGWRENERLLKNLGYLEK